MADNRKKAFEDLKKNAEFEDVLLGKAKERLVIEEKIKKISEGIKLLKEKGVSADSEQYQVAMKRLTTLKNEKKIVDKIRDSREEENKINDKTAALQFDIAGAKKKILSFENDINKLGDKNLRMSKSEMNFLLDKAKAQQEVLQNQIETANVAQTQQQITDKLLGNLNLSAKALGDMKDQAILFGRALMADKKLLLLAALAAAAIGLAKMVEFGKRFRDELGTTLGQSKDLAVKLGDNQVYLKSIGADAVKITGALTQNFGTLDSVTGKTVTRIAEFEKGLGLAPEHTAKIMKNMESIGGFTQDQALNQIKSIAAMAKANDMIPNDIMGDLANNTEFFAQYAKDGGDNLAKAAMEARKLGLNLSTTAKIADSLLDFESSIEKEMEAALLTGKQLNYNRARALALEGDVAGAAKEVVKQVGGQAEFNKMNMIQRKALADSIGVSVEEMSKMTSGKPMELKKAKGDPLEGEMNKLEMATAANSTAVISATAAIVGLGAMKFFGKDGLKGLSKLFGGGGGKSALGPLTKAGKPDMRFAVNKLAQQTTKKAGGGLLSKVGGFLGGVGGKVGAGALGGLGKVGGVLGKAGGLLGKVGGKALGGAGAAIFGGMDIFKGLKSGDKSQTGGGIGSIIGTGLGAFGGPVGMMLGGLAGDFIGRQIGGMMNNKSTDGVDPNGAFKTNNQAAKVQAQIAAESAIKLQNKTSDGQTIVSQQDIARREFDDLNDKDKDMYRGMMESGDMTVENLSMMVEGLPTLIADAIRNNPNDVYLIQQKEYLDAMIAAMKENTQAVNNLVD